MLFPHSAVLAMSVICLSTLLSPPVTSAQGGTIRGELSCESCRFSTLSIGVEDQGHTYQGSFPVSPSGSFDLYGLRDGMYVLTIRENGEPIQREDVYLRAGAEPVSLRLRSNVPPGSKPVSGTISVARLRHNPPKVAKKLYDKGEEAAAKGDLPASIVQLRKALEIDPLYLEAHNNLGSRLLRTGHLEDSLASFKRAAELDPSTAMLHTNVAVALMAMHQFADAEHSARRATQMPGADAKSRYMLGLSLYAQKKYTDEAVSLLDATQGQFNSAGIALAAIYAARGEVAEARQVLCAYLKSGKSESRREVERMLATLK